jgi:hypothetical protein
MICQDRLGTNVKETEDSGALCARSRRVGMTARSSARRRRQGNRSRSCDIIMSIYQPYRCKSAISHKIPGRYIHVPPIGIDPLVISIITHPHTRVAILIMLPYYLITLLPYYLILSLVIITAANAARTAVAPRCIHREWPKECSVPHPRASASHCCQRSPLPAAATAAAAAR